MRTIYLTLVVVMLLTGTGWPQHALENVDEFAKTAVAEAEADASAKSDSGSGDIGWGSAGGDDSGSTGNSGCASSCEQ